MHNHSIKSVLVIGSGPIVIGQAAEFDYAGTQGCLALKEEGIRVILLNPNPATVMTDEHCADVVYFERLTAATVENIIKKEKPDGLLATLGGQTGLNLALKLHDEGTLEKYGVSLLGTPIESIKKGEDRERFRDLMNELQEPVPESDIIHTVEEAVAFSEKIDFPIIVRPAYTLGGSGGGIAQNVNQLRTIVANGIRQSPINQCLIEKSIAGFKEIEYEVMRDSNDTCITICNMENIDPVGIHTGDSIVVAPSQTLTDRDYQMLRSASTKIIRALGIIGGCNIQFALDPHSDQYYLIEVNPRVSRSSALASKATGYPIARIAAKLAVGYHLHELLNPVTGHTYASFEPALDYCIVKFPRWPFDKFYQADRTLGTQMKATGEVMAIERSFGAALQKAIRSLEIGIEDLARGEFDKDETSYLWTLMSQADDRRLFILFELLRRGINVEELHQETKIDRFFLQRFASLIEVENDLKAGSLQSVTKSQMEDYKKAGFSDQNVANLWGVTEVEVRDTRLEMGIKPVYKMVDTCAGEFEAQTPYFYSSYFGENESLPSPNKKIIIIGSGPIRIGQGIEFDYCSVHGAKTIRELGYEAIIINNNPETVSTDYMTADRLYFEPLALEDVVAIVNHEHVEGVVVTLGGQTGIKLTKELEQAGIHVFGVSSACVDELEERDAFYTLLSTIGVEPIPGVAVSSIEEAFDYCDEATFPILVRPSFVIGGQGMAILQTKEQVEDYLKDHPYKGLFPLLMDTYVQGVEIDVDVLTDGEEIYVAGMFEHVEQAGVHSGDSLAITPPYRVSNAIQNRLEIIAKKLADAMAFKGIFNIQFVVQGEDIYVIEVNPRASRTVPLLAKLTGEPFVAYATRLMLGETIDQLPIRKQKPSFFAAKAPVFSYGKLSGLDPKLGAEMKSTGELLMIGETPEEALAKVSAPFETLPSLFEDHLNKSVFLQVEAGIEEYVSPLLQEAGFTIETDQFEKWIETTGAKALIDLTLPGQPGNERYRHQALAQQLSVFTEQATVAASLYYYDHPSFRLKSIAEWRDPLNVKKESTLCKALPSI
ncbi:carbamoyl phosphate synthase large subunit [Shouchella miscanthi]|uniref:Carbamoyl phosphate synthase large chain n=1 Tax=Shouchella miscanthi TaxID=2598861 RepID=A0ABU6NHD0_9BACI|nr:carbamoyl phosphate synthase large subunit [Shouchella miscanthi]MED4127608.1 carbamoyl phosphate synthase large subunit [Shouchella miscanthi]